MAHKLLAMIPFFLAISMLITPIGGGPTCINPPLSTIGLDPSFNGHVLGNTCHIYTWRNFPMDTGITPKTGLFGNDTSYDFAINITGITNFQICANVLKTGGDNNETLILQYLPASGLGTGTWTNVDTSPSGSAGSWVVPPGGIVNLGTSQIFCGSPGPTMGTIDPNLVNDQCTSQANFCEFRIAGNQGITCPTCGTSDTVIFSNIVVMFFENSVKINGIIVCGSTSHSTSTFNNQCRASVAPLGGANIGVTWDATNRSGTGAGCGATDTCEKFGTVTCTINAGANLCQNLNVAFGQTFTGTVRVLEDWNLLSTGSLPSPSFAYPVIE